MEKEIFMNGLPSYYAYALSKKYPKDFAKYSRFITRDIEKKKVRIKLSKGQKLTIKVRPVIVFIMEKLSSVA